MPAEFDKLVSTLKGKPGIKNPFAVARAQLGSDKQILARRGKAPALTRGSAPKRRRMRTKSAIPNS